MNDYLNKNFGLRARRALVTGASRGIGRSIAEALASAGAEVCVHYNKSRAAAEEVVYPIRERGGSAWSARADLTRSKAVAELFKKINRRWSALDILVNNAGDMMARRVLAETDDRLLDRLLRVNLHSTLIATRAAIPLLQRGNSPVIINSSSISAHSGGGGGVTVYSATKGAIHTFTRGLAKELAPRIRVNAIAPGVIMTDLHRKLSSKQKLRNFAKATPLQRNGQPEDCAGAVVFLAGAGASFITGEVIEINGGLWVA